MKAPAAPVKPRENPLVPFATMRRIHAGMVETRLLEERLAKARGEGKRSPLAGQEACRSAVLSALEATDIVSEVPQSVSSAWLRGASLGDLLGARTQTLDVLPHTDDARLRFGMALGAAVAVKRAKLPGAVVVFVEEEASLAPLWSVVRLAAERELAMLFVVLPPVDRKKHGRNIGAKATSLGVPGIAVDGGDAVALFRVAQESLLRARTGGGPALMEAIPFPMPRGKRRSNDPIAAMQETLLRAGACDQAWLDAVAPNFQARLKTAVALASS